MKFSPRLKKSVRIAAPALLALLLTIALLPGVALANPPPEVPVEEVQGQPPPEVPVEEVQGQQPPEVPDDDDDETPAPTPAPTPAAHPSAPPSAPAGCVVAHAATPAQLCSIAGGLQYYFIGADGSSNAGPYIHPFSELATLHTSVVSLYSGTNPFTGKSVQIHYLPADQKIRVSTFYPDTQYDTNKPYNFTVNSSNSVTHEAW